MKVSLNFRCFADAINFYEWYRDAVFSDDCNLPTIVGDELSINNDKHFIASVKFATGNDATVDDILNLAAYAIMERPTDSNIRFVYINGVDVTDVVDAMTI